MKRAGKYVTLLVGLVFVVFSAIPSDFSSTFRAERIICKELLLVDEDEKMTIMMLGHGRSGATITVLDPTETYKTVISPSDFTVAYKDKVTNLIYHEDAVGKIALQQDDGEHQFITPAFLEYLRLLQESGVIEKMAETLFEK